MSRTLFVARVTMLVALLAVAPVAIGAVAPAPALSSVLCGTTITGNTTLNDDVGPCWETGS